VFKRIFATDVNDDSGCSGCTCEISHGDFTCENHRLKALCFDAILWTMIWGGGAISL
jgi:hypothetical protein